jgi:hypothetical protein
MKTPAKVTPIAPTTDTDRLVAVLERIAGALEDIASPIWDIADTLTDARGRGRPSVLDALVAIARHTPGNTPGLVMTFVSGMFGLLTATVRRMP